MVENFWSKIVQTCDVIGIFVEYLCGPFLIKKIVNVYIKWKLFTLDIIDILIKFFDASNDKL